MKKVNLEIEIREFSLNDLNDLSVLFDEYRVFYNKKSDLKSASQFLEKRYLNEESKIFIATSTQLLIGFVQLYPLFSSTRLKKLWMLNDLFVHQDYRQLGVAKSLIAKSKDFAEETNSCGFILETAKDNIKANNLYKLMSLEKDVLHHYYSFNLES